MDQKARRDHARSHINPKLRRSLRIFLAISVIIFIFVIVDTIRYQANVWQVALAMAAGILIGFVFARMNKLSWDKDAQQVSSNIDVYGAVLLVLYIGFDLNRGHIVHIFTHNNGVPAISLALLAGAMYGRVLGSGHTIVKILREQEVFGSMHRHPSDQP